MNTLYIDTHSNKIIINLFRDKKVFIKKEIETNNNHSITIMPILVEALNEAKIDVNDLNEIIVVNGPGSFTGVRLGVTIAKTLAYEKEKNGVFIGTFNKNNELIGEYTYLRNSEYLPSEKDILDVQLDYEKIIRFTDNIRCINSHAVNPIYIKQIEVQK